MSAEGHTTHSSSFPAAQCPILTCLAHHPLLSSLGSTANSLLSPWDVPAKPRYQSLFSHKTSAVQSSSPQHQLLLFPECTPEYTLQPRSATLCQLQAQRLCLGQLPATPMGAQTETLLMPSLGFSSQLCHTSWSRLAVALLSSSVR